MAIETHTLLEVRGATLAFNNTGNVKLDDVNELDKLVLKICAS